MAMKLWVVGEASPDPGTWSIWSEVGLVLAESAEEAIRLDGRGRTEAVEIPMDRPLVLVRMPEPDWGDDI